MFLLNFSTLCFLPDTVRKEAATIAAVFPSPKDVMSILVQVWLINTFCGSLSPSFIFFLYDGAVSAKIKPTQFSILTYSGSLLNTSTIEFKKLQFGQMI